ncbi:MAG: flagellar hook-associated protein FlgK [Acidobacteriota bacterium]
MGGIFGALQIGLKNLSNMREGLAVVNENVANVNTPGYSRKRMILQSGPADYRPYGSVGTGADIQRIESVRDYFLESRLRAEYETKGFFEGQQSGTAQLESLLSTGDEAGLPEQMSRFFNSFLELSASPSSIPLRQAVISEGEQLASWFQRTSSQVDSLQLNNHVRVKDSVDNINFLLSRISVINSRLEPLLARGQDGGSLFDERQELLKELSTEIGIQVTTDQTGSQTISTTNGRLLLAGSDYRQLSAEETSSGMVVRSGSADITSELKTGRLGGLLSFEDTVLASFRTSLNSLTKQLAEAVNSTHRNGVDLDGNAGQDFFQFSAGAEAGTISVVISDPRAIAAATSGGVGDGRNAQTLADIREQSFAGLEGQSVHGFYSQMAFEVGLAMRGVKANAELQDKILRELQNQREAVSGVSLDEEAVNLLQYQRSYQASSRLIKVLDQLLEETLGLVRS